MSGYDPTRRVPLGQVVATPGALAAIVASDQTAHDFLRRHVHCDWGEVNDEDAAANEQALACGKRILSAYRTKRGVKLWIITEADRASTTILLPNEY